MKLFEVKNDIAKIIYNTSENHLLPSDFLLIEDVNQKLVAQIENINTTKSTDDYVADARLVLSIDKEDNLSYYNGYIPSKSSVIVYINSSEIIELIKGQQKSIYLGNLSNYSDCNVEPSIDFINDRLYIQSDREDNTKIIIQNIVSELNLQNEKVVVLDFDGCYNSVTDVAKLKIAEDLKFPLDIEAFNTILDYDIEDAPLEDKVVVQSIILELREYLKTLKDKFIPFNLFKSVIDNEFASNPVSGLMLLKNKLYEYAQESLFAENIAQFEIINKPLNDNKVLIIDASNLNENWYKYAILAIKNILSQNCYFVVSLNDAKMDKKAILNLYNSSNLIPIVYTNYDSEYSQILKSICKNQILLKPSKNIEIDEKYSILLNKINTSEFIIYGESTLYLPLILELQSFTSKPIQNQEISQPNIEDIQEASYVTDLEPENKEDEIIRPMSASSDIQTETLISDNETEEIIAEDDDLNDSDLDFLDEQTIEPLTVEEDDILNQPLFEENKYDVFEPMQVQEKSETVDDNVVDENDIDNILSYTQEDDEIIEDDSEISDEEAIENDTVNEDLELTDDSRQALEDEDDNSSLETIDEIVSDTADEVVPLDDVINDITSKLENTDNAETAEISDNVSSSDSETLTVDNEDDEETEEDNDDNTSEDDFVVELESDEEELVPPPVNENISKKESPELTVYETDNSSNISINDIPFQKGDRVYHPKHGYGVIEGFANYSNKILFCQIEFEKVGRRILDPRIAGIEKVS